MQEPKQKKLQVICERLTEQQVRKRYQQCDYIDKGTYGQVYKWYDTQTGQYVAAKMSNQNSFNNEVQIMNKIHHDNVINCLHYFEFKDIKQKSEKQQKKCIVMPLCELGSLKTLGKQLKELNQKQKTDLCLQTAKGVSALHALNLIHRDLKPANVIITNKWVPKICDFGFGRDDDDYQKTTQVGSLAYKDPVIDMGRHQRTLYTKSCDIYSLGHIFYFIFQGESVYGNLKQITDYPSKRQRLNKNPEQFINRMQSSQEMKKLVLSCFLTQKQNQRRPNIHQIIQKLQKMAKQNNIQQIIQVPQKLPSIKKIIEPTQLSKITQRDEQNAASRITQIFKKQQSLSTSDKQKAQPFQFKSKDKISPKSPNLSPLKLNKSRSSSGSIFFESPSQKKQSSSFNNIANSNGSRSNEQKIIYEKCLLQKKLLRFRQKIGEKLNQNQNFTNVYKFFDEKRNKIRQLNTLQSFVSISKVQKKVIIFVALCGYIRFLKVHICFLQNDENSDIKNILGIPYRNISEGTKTQCLKIIKDEMNQMRKAIEQPLYSTRSSLSSLKHMSSNLLTNLITEGNQKKFIEIHTIKKQQILNQFIRILEIPQMKKEAQLLDKKKLKQVISSVLTY